MGFGGIWIVGFHFGGELSSNGGLNGEYDGTTGGAMCVNDPNFQLFPEQKMKECDIVDLP